MNHKRPILIAVFLCLCAALGAKARYAEEPLFSAWERFLAAWEKGGGLSASGDLMEDELLDLEDEITAYRSSDIYAEEHGDGGDERMDMAERLVADALRAAHQGDEEAWRTSCAALIPCMTAFMKSTFEKSRSYFVPFVLLLAAISALGILVVIIGLEYSRRSAEMRRLSEENERRLLVVRTTTKVEESERGRISRDLHDTVMQDIRTVLLHARRLGGAEKETADQIIMLSDRAMTSVRQIVRNLAPPEIESANFMALLAEHCAGVEKSGTMRCTFYAGPGELYQRLSAEQKLNIFRIVQESITNAVKHSGAEEISVIAREEDGERLVFLVSDDGHGFDGSQAERNPGLPATDETGTRLGICGMKSRAAMLGADLVIKSHADSGTQVKLTVRV